MSWEYLTRPLKFSYHQKKSLRGILLPEKIGERNEPKNHNKKSPISTPKSSIFCDLHGIFAKFSPAAHILHQNYCLSHKIVDFARLGAENCFCAKIRPSPQKFIPARKKSWGIFMYPPPPPRKNSF